MNDNYKDDKEPVFDDGFLDLVCRNEHSEPGLIYVLKSNGLYKIGKTKNFTKRLSTIKSCSPCEIEIILVKEVHSCSAYEKSLHSMFGEFRIRGEWFDLSEGAFADLMNQLK